MLFNFTKFLITLKLFTSSTLNFMFCNVSSCKNSGRYNFFLLVLFSTLEMHHHSTLIAFSFTQVGHFLIYFYLFIRELVQCLLLGNVVGIKIEFMVTKVITDVS